jgi:hypothetical protein
MKREHCDCRQGRDPCTCGVEDDPRNAADWWLLLVCAVLLGLLIHNVALRMVPGW